MDDAHQILHHLLLRTHVRTVGDDDLSPVLVGQVLHEVEPEPGEPILVCHDHDAYLTVDDPVDEFQELGAVEVHASADLLPHLVHVAARRGEIHHRLSLVGEVVLLPGAADPAVDDAFLLRVLMLQSQQFRHVLLRVASTARRPCAPD